MLVVEDVQVMDLVTSRTHSSRGTKRPGVYADRMRLPAMQCGTHRRYLSWCGDGLKTPHHAGSCLWRISATPH
jgi:hypothetical protein